MAERILGRPWSDEEDALLTAAVKIHGEHDNWKTIALSVPGRTNKACRKRWLHSLSPTVRKSAWTPAEDNLLLDLYKRHGARWSTIARAIPGRTDDACSKRYREALDPNLKKDDWTPDEDEKLMKLYSKLGGKWGQVGQELQRSGLGCRNRWRLLSRKATKAVCDPQPFPSTDLQDQCASHAEAALLTPSQENVHGHGNWPPYYPPEAYHCFPHDESLRSEHGFREPTPEVLPVLSHVAPFQFSSSSLSAALSDPPRAPAPLPPIQDCEPPPSASPSPPNISTADELIFDQVSQDSFLLHSEDQMELAHLLSGTRFDSSDMVYYVGAGDLPLSSPSRNYEMSDHVYEWGIFPNIITLPPSIHPPLQDLPGLSIQHNGGLSDDICSTSSTPSIFHPSLSTTSSPNAPSPIELFPNDHDSRLLLFPPDHRSRPPRKAQKSPKKATKPQGPARLSSMLALTTDSSVRPYACGREMCWPADAAESSARFATSKELFDHVKIEHSKDPPGDRPFRCALAGCGKSWKSLNGVQYHLQLSTAHFRTALSSSFSSQGTTSGSRRATHPPEMRTETDSTDEAKRIYVCHHPHCFKAYRQPSGLRYHLRHGHPDDMPAQLDLHLVPPALARQMPSKTRKMRQKASTEGDA